MPMLFRPENSKLTPAQKQTQLRGRAIRRRLFVLVATLLLVLFLMREARKPENYEWLTRLQKQGGESPGNLQDITDDVHRPSDGTIIRNPSNTATIAENKPAANSEITTNPQSFQKQKATGDRLHDFWASFLAPLNAEEQIAWFQLITLTPEVASEESTARNLIDRFQSELDRAMQETLEFSARASNQSLVDIEGFTAERNDWEHSVKPALESLLRKDPLSNEQQQAMSVWTDHVYSHAVGLIDDLTEVARPSDSLAWLLTWRRVMHHSLGEPRPTSSFELITQPEVYRSQPVRLDGTLRGIESTPAGPNPFGIERYWILWVQPRNLERTPCCIYAAELPHEIRGDPSRFQNVRQPIALEGIFWKVRTYVDSQNEVASCPLILAKTASLKTIQAAPEVYRWQPSGWFLWSLIGVLPVLAIAIAWRIFRNGRVQLQPESPGKSRQLRKSLDELQSDDSIMNDRQRIAKLNAGQGDS